jgi:hypothetical protein
MEKRLCKEDFAAIKIGDILIISRAELKTQKKK